ncbi:hypothetical protein [Cellulophaga sp. BC115SP]|uniref:hypothetical protein n=1 Tax=Cellulophaga sp. BC115SP TaxID=2683263 RepID=UPI001411D3E6|nr:hypothetical protein [Cellulophaga sp. BC115SP]NBB26995.1 hypothetical protein [Cellulophaga sp. BC115SP]
MKKIFKFKELIVLSISIASTIFFFDFKKSGLIIGLENFDSKNLPIYSASLNILVLVISIMIFSTLFDDFYFLRRKHGEYDNSNFALDDLKAIEETLKISSNQTKYYVERTSAVVGQLVRNFSLFLWPLIIFYALNIVKDKLNLSSSIYFEKSYSFYEFTTRSPIDKHNGAFWYIILSALANFFNFLSGIGLWVSFSILYQKTVDADNKSTLHLGVHYFLLIFYMLAYVVLIGSGLEILTIKMTILTLDMFCSIFNCVAMILFFNRLVQILYFFQTELKKNLLDKFYFFTATILLPLYACFQIFFGAFDFLANNPQYSEYYTYFKGTVFFVCFLGKLFLILFMFSFIRIKWLHAAIITLMANEGTPLLLAQKVKAISNSIGQLDEDLMGKDLTEN